MHAGWLCFALLLPAVLCSQLSGQDNRLTFNALPWLDGLGLGILVNGVPYSTKSGNLKLLSTVQVSGLDRIGAYKGVNKTYLAGPARFVISQLDYAQEGAVRYSQYFPDEVKPSVAKGKSVFSSCFQFSTSPNNLAYLTYFSEGVWPFPQMGPFTVNTSFASDTAMAGQPTALYQPGTSNVLILSSLTYPQSAAMGKANNGLLCTDGFSAGLLGSLSVIPAGTEYSFLAVGSDKGMNKTMRHWGSLLLKYAGKKHFEPHKDRTYQRLSYYTDNGAYYYYHTENNTKYPETLSELGKYFKSLDLPVRSVQLDSWWYEKSNKGYGNPGGILSWTEDHNWFGSVSVADAVRGMNLYKPVGQTLHSRWFAPNNVYLGQYEQVIESLMTLPVTPALFKHIMGVDAGPGGLAVYEQDWLGTQWSNIEALRTNITLPHLWFESINRAALEKGLSVQMCMPIGHQWIHSIWYDAFRMSRVGDDYQPGNDDAQGDQQWRIGYASLFAYSLGLVPFKDNFWSSSEFQADCPYGHSSCVESNPELQAIVATLTSGVVAFSDRLNHANKTNIMRTCSSEGVVLAADVPATIIDTVFRKTPTIKKEKQELVESTVSYTEFGNKRWYYILAANISEPLDVTLADIDGIEDTYLAFFHEAERPVVYDQLTAQKPLRLVPNAKKGLVIPFNFYVLMPKPFESGWYLMGEINKYITVSKNRITRIVDSTDALEIDLVGGAKESLLFSVIRKVDSLVMDVPCTLGMEGRAKITCPAGARAACSCHPH